MSHHLLAIPHKRAGFSLIEVSLALAIMGFAFVSVLGLMSSGLSTYGGSIDATVSAQLAQRVIHDAQQTDFNTLVDAKTIAGVSPDPEFSFRAPAVNTPTFRYFDAEGVEIIPQSSARLSDSERTRATFQVNVRVRPFADLPRPALAKTPQLAQLTVQVVHLHGNTACDVETAGPNRNLLKTRNVPVYTYATLVARNE